MTSEYKLELFKFLLSISVSLSTVLLGWFVGQRLSLRWNLRQKRAELDISSAHRLHELYGEFFAIWKLWNYSLTPSVETAFTRSDLLLRSCAAEGAIEALFIRIAASRNLTSEQIHILGSFRQGYQTLREAIRDNRKINWDKADHPEYLSFKTLATEVALLIFSDKPSSFTKSRNRSNAMIEITKNRSNGVWASP